MVLINFESLDLEQTAKKVTKPLISIIVVTKGNRPVLLEKSLKSIQKQTFQEFEIILVYSIFPNNLSAFLGSNNLFALKENGSTIAAARNFGVRHAKGDLIAFVDDDCEPLENWLEQVYSTFVCYPSLSCLGGPALPPPEDFSKNPLMFARASSSESVMNKICFNRSAVGKLSTSNIAYRKKVFDEIGYFSESYKSGEDFDFNMRLAENGYSIRYDPGIFVWHHSAGGLKHTFVRSSEMVPFYLSWNALRFAKYESIFASFYLANFLGLLMLVILFISPIIFFFLFLSTLLGYFIFVAVRTKGLSMKKIVYFPLTLLYTLTRLFGFYYGCLTQLAQRVSAPRKHKCLETA